MRSWLARSRSLSLQELTSLLSRRREHLLNLGSFFVTRIITLGLFAYSASLFINRVSAADYGILTLLFVLYSYLHIFDLGIGYAVNIRFARRLARGVSRPEDVVRRAIPFYALASLAIAGVLAAAAPAISELLFRTTEYTGLIRLMSLAVVALMFSALCTAVLQAHNKIYIINLSRLSIELIRVTAIVIGALHGGDLHLIVLLTVCGSFVKLLVDAALVARVMGHWRWLKPSISKADLRLNLTYGYPIMLSVGVGMLLNSLDKVFVSRQFSAETLSHYAIAFDVNTKAYFLIWAVNGSLYTLFQRRKATLRPSGDLLKISLASVALVVGLYYVPLALCSETILRIWINPEFAAAAAGSVRLMTIPAVLYLIMSVLYSIIQSRGRPKSIFRGDVIMFVVFCLGLLTLPVEFGLSGVIFSFAIGYVAQILYLAFDLQWAQRAVRKQ